MVRKVEKSEYFGDSHNDNIRLSLSDILDLLTDLPDSLEISEISDGELIYENLTEFQQNIEAIETHLKISLMRAGNDYPRGSIELEVNKYEVTVYLYGMENWADGAAFARRLYNKISKRKIPSEFIFFLVPFTIIVLLFF